MKHHPTIAEQHQQWCIHYKRMPGSPKREACEKGVVYEDLAKCDELGKLGWVLRLPCIRGHQNADERRGQPLCECPHMQFPTIEESKAHEADIREHMKRIDKVNDGLVLIRKEHRGRDADGTIPCPACSGVLHWSHAGYNNHMRVSCETTDCVRWIE